MVPYQVAYDVTLWQLRLRKSWVARQTQIEQRSKEFGSPLWQLYEPAHVVGVTHDNPDGSSRQALIAGLHEDDKLLLLREDGNAYDPNAIAVCVARKSTPDDVLLQIGYLERADAAKYAKLIYGGEPLSATVESIVGGTPNKQSFGIWINVLRASNFQIAKPSNKRSSRKAKAASKKICMKTIAFSMLFLCAVCAFAQDGPITFRGAYLGQPVSAYVDCSSGKARTIQPGYKTHGKLCRGERGWVYHTKSVGVWHPRAEGEILEFQGKVLSKIRIELANNDWEKLRYDLSQKLGEPSSEPPEVYGNLFGARWEFNQGFWRKGDIVAYAGEKVETIGGCGFADTLSQSRMPHPCSDSIELVITTAQIAGTPDKRRNSLD
jgi:hypothetical protein